MATWPVLGLTLAAFGLRVALARGDLWGDEAASVMLSLQPLRQMLATLATGEPHPPLYPLLLKGWMRLAGTGELAVRFPSIAAGTALVPLIAALGRAAGPRAGVVTALLAALSPFLLWYGIEARMYPLAALLAAASFYALLRLLSEGTTTRTVAYGLATALALLSHYFVLYVGLAEVVVAGAAAWRDPRRLRTLLPAGGLALLPVAAWMAFASRIVGSYYGAAPGTVDLIGVLTRTLTRIPAGWSVTAETATIVGIAAAPLVVVGGWLARTRGATRAWIAWLLVPTLAAMGVSLVRPMYQERYLIVIAPPYLLLAGLAIARARPLILRIGLVVAAIAAAAGPLDNLAAGRYVRSQYESHAAEINALGRSGDAVVLTGPSQAPLYDYYASRGGIGLPVFALPHDAPARSDETAAELEGIAGRFDGLWLLLYAEHDYDPGDVVERWLTTHAYRAPPRWTINGRLIRFAAEHSANLGPASPPRPIGDGWRIAAALPTAPVAAGGVVPLRVHLERTSGSSSSLLPKLRLRLTDDRGFLWGETDEVIGSGFGDPAAGRWVERRAVPMLAGAPDGDLRIEAQLYAEERGGARPIGTTDLGLVHATAGDRFWPSQIAGFHAADDTDGGWRLLGWAGADTRQAGERAYVTTVWQAEAPSDLLEQLVRLVGPDGSVASTRAASLAPSPPGTVRRIQMAPPIGTRWRPGRYRIELALRDGAGTLAPWSDGVRWRRLAELRVEAGLPPPAAAEPAVPRDAVFGGAVRLRGYTVTANPFTVTLHWESRRELDANLSVFVHLLDAGGTIRAQSDGPPAEGRAPIDGWLPGDRTDDRRAIAAPPGTYRMVVGVYDPRSGGRLPATTEAGQPLGDSVLLGTIAVGE